MANDGTSAARHLQLLYQLVDDENNILSKIFYVNISSTAIVAYIKDQIYTQNKNILEARGVNVTQLVLWKLLPAPQIVVGNEENATVNNLLTSFSHDFSKFAQELNAGLEVGDYFTEMPARRHLHLIGQVPFSNVHKGKRKQVESNDAVRIIERWRSKRIKLELPVIGELARFVDLPLSEDEKIPISANRMQGLVSSPIYVQDVCTLEDVKLLFRVGDADTPLDKLFFAVLEPPPMSGTENAFISFWDRNVRDVLELLIPRGTSTRNSNQHTATDKLRPDYAFHLNKLCSFRGEEKAPDSTEDPKAELSSKLAWAYSPAPYVLGYYATGPKFTLAAISPSPPRQPIVTDIVHADLQFRTDRIKNIRRLINLAALFESLADLVRPINAEFTLLDRDNGNTVEIAGHNIIKSYKGPDKVQRIMHLRNIYHLLGEKCVPHVDSIVHHFDTTVILSPRGDAGRPKSEQELVAALICVLEALEVLHQSPPIFHRDIRWPNVMRRLDDPQGWFVIDWGDAASPPTTAQTHFERNTHSPCVFVDKHGAEVDMWGVGELIIQSNTLGISLALQDLGKWMQGVTTPSAREALEKIKKYQLGIKDGSIHI